MADMVKPPFIRLDTVYAAPVKATSTLTSNGTNVTAGKVVEVGGETYTFRASLTNGGLPYEVKIGASAAATLDNLKAAINHAAGEGTTYGLGTRGNYSVLATTNTDTTQVVEALEAGVAGNAITTSTDETTLSWTSTVLASGAAQAGTLLTWRLKISQINAREQTAAGHQVTLQDQNGNEIFDYKASEANDYETSFVDRWVNGLKLTKLDSGNVQIILE